MATEQIITFDDLMGLLERNPEYRERLRQQVLDEEFQRLPAQMIALTERVDTLAEQMSALTERVDTLAEQMSVLTERVDILTERVDTLAEQMSALTERVDILTERMDTLTERVEALTEQVRLLTVQMRDVVTRLERHDAQLARLLGDEAERRFQRNAGAYFGELISNLRVIDNNALAIQVDSAIGEGRFRRADRRLLLALDVVARGRDWDTNEEKCLAVEVSVGIGQTDIERAKSRAGLLEQLLGVPAIPVVAGYSIAPQFQDLADGQGVQVTLIEEPG